MTAMLMSLAFLCGIPIGAIVGLAVLWHVMRPERGNDIDYSAGA